MFDWFRKNKDQDDRGTFLIIPKDSLISQLQKEMSEEIKYFAKLQSRFLNSENDPQRSWIIENELALTEDRLRRKDQLLLSLQRVEEIQEEIKDHE